MKCVKEIPEETLGKYVVVPYTEAYFSEVDHTLLIEQDDAQVTLSKDTLLALLEVYKQQEPPT